MVDEWLGRRRVSLHSHYYGADHLTFEVRGQVISERKNLAKNLERKQNSCMEFLATGNHSLYTATVNQRIIQLPGVSIGTLVAAMHSTWKKLAYHHTSRCPIYGNASSLVLFSLRVIIFSVFGLVALFIRLARPYIAQIYIVFAIVSFFSMASTKKCLLPIVSCERTRYIYPSCMTRYDVMSQVDNHYYP